MSVFASERAGVDTGVENGAWVSLPLVKLSSRSNTVIFFKSWSLQMMIIFFCLLYGFH